MIAIGSNIDAIALPITSSPHPPPQSSPIASDAMQQIHAWQAPPGA